MWEVVDLPPNKANQGPKQKDLASSDDNPQPGKVARYDEVYRSCGPLNQLGGIGAHSILVKAPLVEDRADVDVFFREMLGIDY